MKKGFKEFLSEAKIKYNHNDVYDIVVDSNDYTGKFVKTQPDHDKDELKNGNVPFKRKSGTTIYINPNTAIVKKSKTQY